MTSAGRGNESSCSVERPIGRGDRVVLQCGDAFVFVYEGGDIEASQQQNDRRGALDQAKPVVESQ